MLETALFCVVSRVILIVIEEAVFDGATDETRTHTPVGTTPSR